MPAETRATRSLRTPYGSAADPDGILTVVIAPDSFKGSLTSLEVASALAAGWLGVRPDDRLHLVPLADGGEGTLDAIAAAIPDAVTREVGPVRGPDGRAVAGRFLELPGSVAVVELAQASGLPLMEALDPLGASTFGLGEVIRFAIESGMRQIIVGLGGSASTDGGAGALAALGLRGSVVAGSALGDPLAAGGGRLGLLASLDRSAMVSPPPDGVLLLTDVSAPLLGPGGAAAVFAAQKGASPAQIASLEVSLAKFAALLGGEPELAGSGAAGGTGYGLSAALGATIVAGADYLAELTGVNDLIAHADVLITGEGRFDDTSRGGKLVGQLLRVAEAGSTSVALVAGSLAIESGTTFDADLVRLAGSLDAALAEPEHWLALAGDRAARHFSERQSSRAVANRRG